MSRAFAGAWGGRLFYAWPVTDATAAAIAGELALLDPSVRADPEAAARLIDPDFVEVGQSGVLWNRDAILAEFGRASSLPVVVVTDMDARAISAELVLLTYISSIDGRRIRRSSIWRESAEGCRVLFHQGTRID
jgi:hypothetical protein